MTLISEIRRNVADATPLLAVVGVTDLAAERVREAAAGAGHLQQEVEKAVAQFETRPKQWRARVRELDVATVRQTPVLAAHRAKRWAQEVEESYEHLAERGRGVVERARQAAPTQDFLRQGKATLGRAQAAVTTALQAVDDTVAAAMDALTVGRREARDVVGQIGEEPRTPVVVEPTAPADEAGAAPAEDAGTAPAEDAGTAPAEDAGAAPAEDAGTAGPAPAAAVE